MSPIPCSKIVATTHHNLSVGQRPLTDAEERVVLALAKRVLHTRQLKVKADLERRKKLAPPSSTAPLWMPRVDIFDDPSCKDIIATFELPGVSVQEMNVDIKDGKLVVEGTRQMKVKPVNSQYPGWVYPDTPDLTAPLSEDNMQVDSSINEAAPRIIIAELRYGKFRRDNIQLPDGVQKTDVTASLQNGMLKVIWPRHPQAKRVTKSGGDEPLTIKSEDASHLRVGGKNGNTGPHK
ncbi:hypothetical protein E1B28_006585 [Marasmius oreades]|uniref:SHSP domain-containing protein n=1 Tax=Marasmius oreades TaxID=181124 RepID=A0A9P7UWF8_9AGAR|nr:uncharacterized protein E1B28_006585 [Marasmius oreades]KAG7095898.1 hypothetical protein E1B28_006585 [Marasmius oreades]